MAKTRNREILTGVEIGTSTIKVVMGEYLPGDVLSIVGFGECPSLKVVKGEIMDANVTQDQLARALAEAEKASGLEIQDVFLGVTGGHIRSVNSVGSVPIRSPDRKVTDEDVVTVVRNARFSCTLPPDKQVLHYVDRRYVLDGSREITNPVGLVGSRLEAETHVVYGGHNSIQTSCRILADVLSYPATDVAFCGVAAGFGAFSADDMEKGALLIDIGAGTTEYVLFHGAGCFHSGQFTIGCEHIVNDLSLGLQLPIPKCRKMLHDLRQFGSALMTPDGRGRLIKVENVGQPARHVPISTVEQVVELRLRELFDIIMADLRAADVLNRIGTGVHLCGGGALIPDVDRLAQDVFDMPVRIAAPRLLSGKQQILTSPTFLTPVGLIRWGRLTLEIDRQEPRFWEQIRGDTQRVWQMVKRALHW